MAVQHIRRCRANRAEHPRQTDHITWADVAGDWDPTDAELKPRRQVREGRFGRNSAGRAVGDQPDGMAALRLSIGEVADMAKQSADRRANHVENA
jgi:hypothetical protein